VIFILHLLHGACPMWMKEVGPHQPYLLPRISPPVVFLLFPCLSPTATHFHEPLPSSALRIRSATGRWPCMATLRVLRHLSNHKGTLSKPPSSCSPSLPWILSTALPWMLFYFSNPWILWTSGRRCYEMWPEVMPMARCFEVVLQRRGRDVTDGGRGCYQLRPPVLHWLVAGAAKPLLLLQRGVVFSTSEH
jgi:hypothetical protein